MVEENRTQWYWDLIIDLESKKDEIESCLPNVTDSTWEEYCMIVNVLGGLYEGMSRLS